MSSPLTRVFANPQVMARGWYWALPSTQLNQGDKRELKLFGETLLLYRGTSGSVQAIDAYCPHMGAHLKEGRVEGDAIRCAFHGWKFSSSGDCAEIPCAAAGFDRSAIPRRKIYRVAEKFGMIWIHTHADSTEPLPGFPELEGREVSVRVDRAEIRNCHPTLILGGGVDEEHFLFVHQKTTQASGPLRFDFERLSPGVIRFENVASIPVTSAKGRLFHRVYRGTLSYKVTYWYAATALAELGPPSLPMYSIFAYRPTEDGRTEGLNIYITPKRGGPLGKFREALSLWATRKILRSGGAEDTVIQNSIRLRLSPHALANPPFAAFVHYVNEQPFLELPELPAQRGSRAIS